MAGKQKTETSATRRRADAEPIEHEHAQLADTSAPSTKALRALTPNISSETVKLLLYRVLPVYLLRIVVAGSVGVAAVLLYQNNIIVIRDSTGISLIATVVAFMVLQRVSQAYNRFWEGRTALSQVLGLMNAAATYATSAIPSSTQEQVEFKRELARRMALAFRSLIVYLRSLSANSKAYAINRAEFPMATESETRRLRQSMQPHLWAVMRCIKLISTAFRDGVIDKDGMKELTPRIFGLYAPMEQCAKVANTPYPKPFDLIGRVVLFLFVYTCPFYFVETQGWLTVPLALLVSFSFFGLHESAHLIEDPFGIDATDLLKDDRFESRLQAMLDEVITFHLPLEVKAKEG